MHDELPGWSAARTPMSIRAARLGAVLCASLMAGCAAIAPPPQREATPTPPQVQAVAVAPSAASAAPGGGAPVPDAEKGGTSTNSVATRPLSSPATLPPAVPAPRAAAPAVPAPRAAPPAAAAVAKPDAPPPLDLKSLEARLKETKAIGVFTKLTVKNQVDELLDRFRAFYQGRLQTTLAELRRSYDMLVLKVLALLQDADPPLAKAINASREAIWAILSNRERFDKV